MELDPSDIDDAVTWTLTRAARHIEHRLTAVIAEQGLTTIQFGVLAQLSANGPLTNAELARATFLRPQSMAGVLDGMAHKGLLVRADNRSRGRASPVAISDRGSALFDRAWPAFVEANRPAALGLTDSQGRSLNKMLHHLRNLPD